jgi:hypothetical protein
LLIFEAWQVSLAILPYLRLDCLWVLLLAALIVLQAFFEQRDAFVFEVFVAGIWQFLTDLWYQLFSVQL